MPKTLSIGPEAAGKLQTLCDQAEPGSRIELAPGRYEASLLLTRALTLVGTGGAEATTLVGLGRASVVEIEGNRIEVRLAGLGITGGRGHSGAALSVAGFVALRVEGCRFFDNEANVNGGALSAGWGDVRLNNCEFVNNRAHLGGALLFADAVVAEVGDCTFRDNEATAGAAAAISSACQVRFAGCRFSGNRCRPRAEEPWGGAVLFSAGNARHRPSITFDRCEGVATSGERALWTRPEFPGSVTLEATPVPADCLRLPGLVVAEKG